MAASIDDFLQYITKIYNFAIEKDNNTTRANFRTIQWLRHRQYGDYRWTLLLGYMDQKFLDQADAAGFTQLEFYQDPAWPTTIRIAHTFATMNGVYLKGSPPPDTGTGGIEPPDVNEGDIAGWGGDWINFYADWQNAVKTYPADQGEQFCKDNLAGSTPGSHFKLRPMLEDIDGYNIAMLLLNTGSLSLPDALHQYFQPTGKSGYKTRINDFYQGRFGGDTVNTVEIAIQILLSFKNWVIAAGRTALIFAITGPFAPDMPSVSNLRLFCRGLDDKLQELIAQEKAMS